MNTSYHLSWNPGVFPRISHLVKCDTSNWCSISFLEQPKILFGFTLCAVTHACTFTHTHTHTHTQTPTHTLTHSAWQGYLDGCEVDDVWGDSSEHLNHLKGLETIFPVSWKLSEGPEKTFSLMTVQLSTCLSLLSSMLSVWLSVSLSFSLPVCLPTSPSLLITRDLELGINTYTHAVE